MPLDSNTCFGKGCQDAVVRPGRIDEVDGVIYECVGAQRGDPARYRPGTLTMAFAKLWPVRVAAGHSRTAISVVAGVLAYLLLPDGLGFTTRAVIAWDLGSFVFLVFAAVLFSREGDDASMAENAIQQQDGEWTMFWVTLAGVAFSFVALTSVLAEAKDMHTFARGLRVTLVAATLLISWLTTHVIFAIRYAHEYYTTSHGAAKIDGGLDFPSDDTPDYWDFVYFSLVLGMTFQVSDVQITSRKLRRFATVHGFVGFVFNTIIVALTVNIAASLL